MVEGFKNTEVGIIPRDWEVKEFGQITERIVGGGTPSRSNSKFWDGNIPWTTVKDFATFNPYQTQEYISAEGLKNSSSNLIPKGTIITSTRMGLGKAVIYKVDVSINQDLKAIFPKKVIDTNFLLSWFYFFSKNLEEMGSGSTVMGLSLDDLRKIKLALPPTKAEQTAIATALNDADTLINQLEQLLTKKQNIKTGAMQELLKPKEGWEVKKMGEIVKSIQLGGNYQNSIENTDMPLIKMGNIQRGFITLNKVEHIINPKADEKDRLKYGDILFNTRNTLELVGKVAIWRNELTKAYFNSNIMRIKFKEEFVSSNFFMNNLFNTERILIKLKDIATGTTSVAAIYTRDLLNIEFAIPTKTEQIRIATILTDMDNEIQELEKKIEKYKMLKQGMMQSLLTGKIRLV